MFGSINRPGMGPYPHRVVLAPRTLGWGFHTVGGGTDQGDHRFRPRFVGVVDVWKISDQGMGYYPPRVALALRISDWGFDTMGAGIDSGDHRFRPRFVGVVDVWKNLRSGDGFLSSPGVTGFTNPRLGFPHRGGRCRPGRPPFSTPVCRRCKCMEGSMILGFEFILPGWRWPYKPLKGPWLPVLLEEEDGCSELLIRCANTVA